MALVPKLITILLALTLIGASCGNDDDTAGTDTGTEPAEATTTEATTTTVAADFERPPFEGPAAEIATAYELFFNTETPPEQAAAAIEQRAETEAVVTAAAESGSGATTAEVGGVAVSGDAAQVEFTLSTETFGDIPQQGFAVSQDGTWRVALHTLCSLLALGGSAPDECGQVEPPAM